MKNMSVQEIEHNVSKLPDTDLQEFTKWLVEFLPSRGKATDSLFDFFHALWDKQIENDLNEGRFDKLIAELRDEHERGLTTPL